MVFLANKFNGVYRQGSAYSMVTRARIVAQYIMTNSVKVTATDMKSQKHSGAYCCKIQTTGIIKSKKRWKPHTAGHERLCAAIHRIYACYQPKTVPQ